MDKTSDLYASCAVVMVIPTLFIYNRLQTAADRIFRSRLGWVLVITVAACLLMSAFFSGGRILHVTVLGLSVVAQLVLYRIASEMFRDTHGRLPESAFGEFDYGRIPANAPDRVFSFAFVFTALLLPLPLLGIALK